ncbi:hypothetical protein FHX41_1037 [Actinomadura hallensis]|jgi:hypothetical protein|uniref:Uncharacterized protein n=1 Tax=Actinomadura hallensis TaxID=337895 RepID=A0A543IA24_9ACTN|nr:hypothetical protein [Actinomadura hallensis]TQM67424.1 hypothetical protein FHX41_1037 [Actinomadura hallensis]HLV73835.1 hypothetical protein [Vulgatibacteraceae bacterium]
MSCEHLICARCSNPVVEGRCPTCREARSELHQHGPFASPTLVLAGLIALLFVALVLQRAYG